MFSIFSSVTNQTCLVFFLLFLTKHVQYFSSVPNQTCLVFFCVNYIVCDKGNKFKIIHSWILSFHLKVKYIAPGKNYIFRFHFFYLFVFRFQFFTPLGCKNSRIRKYEFVAKTQFLCRTLNILSLKENNK